MPFVSRERVSCQPCSSEEVIRNAGHTTADAPLGRPLFCWPFAKNAKDGGTHCVADASEIRSLGRPPRQDFGGGVVPTDSAPIFWPYPYLRPGLSFAAPPGLGPAGAGVTCRNRWATAPQQEFDRWSEPCAIHVAHDPALVARDHARNPGIVHGLGNCC
jgi:hypothetical protein